MENQDKWNKRLKGNFNLLILESSNPDISESANYDAYEDLSFPSAGTTRIR